MSHRRMEKAMVSQPRQNGRKRRGTARRSVATVSFPAQRQMPVLRPSFVQTIRRRFQANAVVNGVFTIGTGLNQFQYATTTTNLCPSVVSWRIKSIEGWSNQSPASSTLEGYINITNSGFNDTANNNFNSPSWELVDVTNSVTYTAHVKRSFSTTEPTGSWHTAQTVNTGAALFRLQCSATSTVDITFEVVIPFGGVVGSPVNTTVTGPAVIGNFYALIPISNLTPFAVNVIS